MIEDDRAYYRRRVEVELDRAQTATVRSVARAHSQLAEAYLGKLEAENRLEARRR